LISTLSLHDALPISQALGLFTQVELGLAHQLVDLGATLFDHFGGGSSCLLQNLGLELRRLGANAVALFCCRTIDTDQLRLVLAQDRKSTRLNSSHVK